MTEQNLPDQDLRVVGEDRTIPGLDQDTADELDSRDAERLDPLKGNSPDDYPGAAENNPDNWRQDPLLQEEPGADSENTDVESDQALWDETEEERYRKGDEQVPPEEPTIGEAAADVDFGDPMDEDDVDASNDSTNFGGSPLSQFEQEDAQEEESEDLDG